MASETDYRDTIAAAVLQFAGLDPETIPAELSIGPCDDPDLGGWQVYVPGVGFFLFTEAEEVYPFASGDCNNAGL